MTVPYVPYPRSIAEATAKVAAGQIRGAIRERMWGNLTQEQVDPLIEKILEGQFANGWFTHIDAVRLVEDTGEPHGTD